MNRRIVYDLIQIGALACIVYGVWQLSGPAAWIVAGAGVLVGTWNDVRSSS